MATLETLTFDNLALRSLPIDKETKNYVRQVEGACFSLVEPAPVSNPKTVVFSESALELLDLHKAEIERQEFAQYFSGNKLLPGTRPASHCYCGHQFGYFSGQLGDGAAMYLGEVINSKGERWEMQLKGSGLTPYSRQADGRKVLRSSIREFLCSEAMYHLGIPTTRAGSCVTSDTKVIRDIFYNGNAKSEKATIILRIAPTFIRFGSFEIFKPIDPVTGRKGPSTGRKDILLQLLEYTIKTFYPKIYDLHSSPEERYLAFYKDLVVKTARLVAQWQCVGFCHGVLNTDNMSIVGLTIDYGPFGFMDAFDPQHICNDSDADRGRYRYGAQPEICKWNLMKLGEAIHDALPVDQSLAALEELYDKEYQGAFLSKMRLKLGLLNKQQPEDVDLIEALFETMHKTGADFTNTFRALSRLGAPQVSKQERVEDVTEYIRQQCLSLDELKQASQPSMDYRQIQMFQMLMQSNPGLLDQLGGGISVIKKELEKVEKLKQLRETSQEEKDAKDTHLWNTWIERYRSRLSEDMDEVDNVDEANSTRVNIMKVNNPRFILRNYIAQNAITAAENGDFTEVKYHI
ncbi:predicted protein [Nematostella vectensis]|uniref:Selenoprotein O n=1 Tax=Nematostella vectensis TaxID=45351 RepID=A7RHL6_NEMVE|nr:predicted protein [Nematostella vectensis]|eukprot:XP_001641063.1 predicted protein [Nematostella vectensis]